MKRTAGFLALVAFQTFQAFHASSAEPAAHVTGVVRTTLRPVPGVHVVSTETGRYALTDSAGRFDLGALPAGSYELTIFGIGYERRTGRILVGGENVTDTGEWLLVPLRPDGSIAGLFSPPGDSLASEIAKLAPPPAPSLHGDSLLADSLLRLPPPLPVSPVLELYLTADERARFLRRPEFPERRVAGSSPAETAVQEILVAIVTADSITRAADGTGAPGYESWRQWSERLALLERDSTLADAGPTLRRVRAYARTRAAFAAGATYAGWLAARDARVSLAEARQDSIGSAAAAAPESSAFLANLSEELDRQFVPGAPAPKPPPPPPRKKSKKRRSAR